MHAQSMFILYMWVCQWQRRKIPGENDASGMLYRGFIPVVLLVVPVVFVPGVPTRATPGVRPPRAALAHSCCAIIGVSIERRTHGTGAPLRATLTTHTALHHNTVTAELTCKESLAEYLRIRDHRAAPAAPFWRTLRLVWSLSRSSAQAQRTHAGAPTSADEGATEAHSCGRLRSRFRFKCYRQQVSGNSLFSLTGKTVFTTVIATVPLSYWFQTQSGWCRCNMRSNLIGWNKVLILYYVSTQMTSQSRLESLKMSSLSCISWENGEGVDVLSRTQNGSSLFTHNWCESDGHSKSSKH